MHFDEEDLLKRIVKCQSETVFVSSARDIHDDSKQCGGLDKPCSTLSEGLLHIIPSLFSQLLISGYTAILSRCNVLNFIIRSLESPSPAQVFLNSTIPHGSSIIATSEKEQIERLSFFVALPFRFQEEHSSVRQTCHFIFRQSI